VGFAAAFVAGLTFFTTAFFAFSATFGLLGVFGLAAGALALDLLAAAVDTAFLAALFLAVVAFLVLAEDFPANLRAGADFAVAMVVVTVRLLECNYSRYSAVYSRPGDALAENKYRCGPA